MKPGRRVVPAVTVAAVVVAWWACFFVGRGERPALDALLYFLPIYMTTWSRLADGVLLLWNPYNLCGIPWIATLQGGFFYPTHVLYAALPLQTAYAASGVIHLVATALATAVFARRIGIATEGAALAALVFVLRGQVATALAISPNVIEALLWLPVGAIAVIDLVRAPGRRPVAMLALATGLGLLAGYPQPTVYVVYAWGALLLAVLVSESRPIGAWAPVVVRFALALALGGALAAVQMIPALELTAHGTRATGALAEKAMLPYGELTPALKILGVGALWGTPYAYGVIALALMPAAVLLPGRRALGWCAIVLGSLAAVFSLGRRTPFFDLYLALPAMGWFRTPSRLLVIVDWCVAIAAGLGLTALIGRPRAGGDAPERRVRGPAIAAALGLVVLVVLARRGFVPKGGVTTVLGIAAAVAVLLVAIAAVSVERRRWIARALVLAAVAETAFHPPLDFRIPSTAKDVAPYHSLEAAFRRLATLAGHDRVWELGTSIDVDLAPKLAPSRGIREIADYEPLNLKRQADYFSFLTEGATVRPRYPWLFAGAPAPIAPPPGVEPLSARRRLLDVASVRFVVMRQGSMTNPQLRALVGATGWNRRTDQRELMVFENPRAVPRAYVTYRTKPAPADADALLGAMSSPLFDPLGWSFVEGESPFPEADDAPARGHEAMFVSDAEHEVELEVVLERPGLVVLGDSFYPGWSATVDGVAAPIVATNHLFRGVPAPAGTHRVRFVYAPASIRLGALLSLVAAIVILWLSWSSRLPRTHGPCS